MLEDTFVAARGRAGRPPLIKHESAPGMSGTRLQKRARAGAREATLFRGFRTRRFPSVARRSRPARRKRVRRARSGGGAGLEARSRLRGYPRVDQAVGGLIRCSSGPAATISLCAAGGLGGDPGKRICRLCPGMGPFTTFIQLSTDFRIFQYIRLTFKRQTTTGHTPRIPVP